MFEIDFSDFPLQHKGTGKSTGSGISSFWGPCRCGFTEVVFRALMSFSIDLSSLHLYVSHPGLSFMRTHLHLDFLMTA